MIHQTPLPSGSPDFAWAQRVWAFVQTLTAEHGEIEFFGSPAEQWKLACEILEDVSRASEVKS